MLSPIVQCAQDVCDFHSERVHPPFSLISPWPTLAPLARSTLLHVCPLTTSRASCVDTIHTTSPWHREGIQACNSGDEFYVQDGLPRLLQLCLVFPGLPIQGGWSRPTVVGFVWMGPGSRMREPPFKGSVGDRRRTKYLSD